MLRKENVYINLQGKTKEELTDLWEFLNNAGEKQYDDKENFINDNYYKILSLDEDNEWYLCLEISIMLEDKTEVTIEQLKEILQPIDTLEQQLEKAKAEVERLEKEIEYKKIKVGDWAINTLTNVVFKVISLEIELQDHYKKITNPQLIELLENEIK